MATRLPISAAMRLDRTPPDPPPITKRSKSYSGIGFPFDDVDANGGVRDHKCRRQADEQTVLDNAGYRFQRSAELHRVFDAAERAIVDQIAAVGSGGDLALHAKRDAQSGIAEFRRGLHNAHRDDGMPKFDNLHRQWKPPESPDELRAVRDDNHPVGRCRNDLLAQKRAAAAFDEIERAVRLVCTIDRKIERRQLLEWGDRDAKTARLDGGAPRCGSAGSRQSSPDT